MAGGCGLEAMSLCSAVRGDAGAEGERKWGNNEGRSEGENEWGRQPFFVGWLRWCDEREMVGGLLFEGEKFK